MIQRRTIASAAALVLALLPIVASAEVVYLNNGDTIHGTLVAANNEEVTLETPYGKLVIPKAEIARIDYTGGAGGSEAPPSAAPAVERPSVDLAGGRGSLALHITGRSFWYAFEAPPESATDTSIRLRLYVGTARACTFHDEKPDTIDGSILYNSFTFSPTDARLVETLEEFQCSVEKAESGEVTLTVGLPAEAASGRQLIRMLYEVNEGSQTSPFWRDVVSRSFSVELAPGKEAVVILEQDADALEYSGFFKKQMKNVEQFQLNVLSTELRS